ncbi:hypothetical protein CCR87_04205 [Rhodobaculum claviforme]|uniref:Transposase DDE domain-containing protein n=1 Tax=Rhodobaculum claviforme TaxID=1549854 RepID=A0A934WI63_9RHOB|nr:hypothetical protein [Rhodobaculum claviforme]
MALRHNAKGGHRGTPGGPARAPRARNRLARNQALGRRGQLTVWFDPATTWQAAPTAKTRPRSITASRRSVFTRSPAFTGISGGATSMQSCPISTRWRCGP